MSCSSCLVPEDAVGSEERKLLPLCTLPAADHGNMKLVSFQTLFVLRVLCLLTPAGGEPQLRVQPSGLPGRAERFMGLGEGLGNREVCVKD